MEGSAMWLIANYRPAALFSFKIGVATSTAAKSLFLPTPFAIRTALLDAAIRTQGLTRGQELFESLKALRIAASLPNAVAVTNLFAKVQKPKRNDKKKDEEDEDDEDTSGSNAMTKSIAFREYMHLEGNLALAFLGDADAMQVLGDLLPQINYFGKRGSFFQLIGMKSESGELPKDFYALDGMMMSGSQVISPIANEFPLGIIQLMDDWGDELTFEKVDIYSGEKIVMDKDRVRKGVILPFRLARSSKSFSLYERIE